MDYVLGMDQTMERIPQVMIRTIGYTPLISQDKTKLVQVFTDLDTGLTIRTTVATRAADFLTWGPATEVQEID